MTTTLEMVASGPFTTRARDDGAHEILDARGQVFAIVLGEWAHHDAPILAGALSGRRALVERAEEAERLEEKVGSLECEVEHEEERRLDAERALARMSERLSHVEGIARKAMTLTREAADELAEVAS